MKKQYIAKMSLGLKGGVVKPGNIVPDSYPRLEEAIKRGWVEEIMIDKIDDDKKKRVFVVHGRNTELKDQIFEFLKSLELEPIDFSEAERLVIKSTPDILDVIKAAFNHAQAVVVLFTPDDLACLQTKFVDKKNDPLEEKSFMLQARQNVVFEAGLAYAKNEKHTIFVQIGRLKRFSDLAGKIILQLDNTEEKKKRFINRLVKAKCCVNDSSGEWMEKGDFRIKREPSIDKEISKILENTSLRTKKYQRKDKIAPKGKHVPKPARRYQKLIKTKEIAQKTKPVQKEALLILPDYKPWDRSEWIYRIDRAYRHTQQTQGIIKDFSGAYIYADLPEGHTLDYEIGKNSPSFSGKNVSIQLSYGKNGSFYIKTEITTKLSSEPPKDGWIQIWPANEFNREYLEKWHQWRVWLPYEWKEKTWQLFKINIPELVSKTYGEQGYEFSGLLGFRIRNEMSIAKIEIYK